MEITTPALILKDLESKDVSFDVSKYLIKDLNYKKDFAYKVLDKSGNYLGYILYNCIQTINEYKLSELAFDLDIDHVKEAISASLEDVILNHQCIKIIAAVKDEKTELTLMSVGFIFSHETDGIRYLKITKPLYLSYKERNI